MVLHLKPSTPYGYVIPIYSNKRYGKRCCHASSRDVFTSLRDVPCTLSHVPVGLDNDTLPIVTVDCDYVMDMYIKAGMEDRDPYWTCIWPSSQVLASSVLTMPNLVEKKRVADFGAGLGLAGVGAGLAGAAEVVFLDREPLSLECSLLNAYMNGLHVCQNPPEMAASFSHVRGETASYDTPVYAEVFDWNKDVQDPHGFDVIVACDVLYEARSIEAIARVMPELVKEEGGTIILADPPNRARANREKFIGLMKVSGFRVTEECTKMTKEVFQGDGHLDGKEERLVPITFMILSR